MSNFPGSLDTDATLYVAKDNITTTLSVALAPGDTSVVLASGTGWAANMIASIELEQMLVTSVLGQVLTVTRAFGGTSAVAHAAGKTVANLVDAAYQSAAKSAIIAIETALGPNLVNVPVSPDIKANTYAFTPLTPGGSLGIGANTITLSPMPAGLNAAAVNTTYLYISGGVGTAEAVPVIGVGASTVTVTCANTHSGAWTIQSATGGISEAINVLPVTGGTVRLSGKYTIYGPILAKTQGIHLLGDAFGWAGWSVYGGTDRTCTQIHVADGANLAYALKAMRGSFVFEHIEIDGNKANQTGGTGYGIWITSDIKLQQFVRMQNFAVYGAYGDGIRITAEGGFYMDVGSMTNFSVRDCGGNCCLIDSTPDWTLINPNMGGSGASPNNVLSISGGGTIQVFGGVLDTGGANLISIFNSNRVQVVGCRGDSSGKSAVALYGNNSEIFLSNLDFEDLGSLNPGAWAGFEFNGGTEDAVVISDCRVRNRTTVNTGYGLAFTSGTVTGLQVLGCNFRNVAHTTTSGVLPSDAIVKETFGLNLPTQPGAALTPAAGVIVITNEVHHIVSGAVAIQTINTSASLTLYYGHLYLIFDGPAPANLVTGNNIARAVTPAAGQMVILFYDSSTGLWYPAA